MPALQTALCCNLLNSAHHCAGPDKLSKQAATAEQDAVVAEPTGEEVMLLGNQHLQLDLSAVN